MCRLGSICKGRQPAEGAGVHGGELATNRLLRQGALALIRGHVTDSRSEGKVISHDATRNWLLLSSYHLTDEHPGIP